MSTQTQPTRGATRRPTDRFARSARPQPPLPAGAATTTVRRRDLLSGVLVGVVAALVAILIVVPGATEPVTTGATLVAFALGWAVMGALTGRRTARCTGRRAAPQTVCRVGQSQRWAYVPATAMGVAGIALLVVRPGEAGMDALNWGWPPLMLALVGWLYLELRRAIPCRSRWVVTPVLVVLVLASLGALYGNVATARARGTYTGAAAAPGKLYEVAGHRLHLDCHGAPTALGTSTGSASGSPTVVLVNGLGGSSAGWARITSAVSATTRVCAYDRAGQGWSEEASSPRDGNQSADELHALLARAGEHGPFVLVGHSTGGTYAMTYAARYPHDVAGLVLLDSSSPEQVTRMPEFAGQYKLMMRPLYGLVPTLGRLGIVSLLPGASHLPPADAARADAIASAPKTLRNQRDEVSVIPRVFEQAQALTTFGHRPLAVLTASANIADTRGWAAAQDALTRLSTNAVRRTVDSSHEGLLDDPQPAQESVRAISQVVIATRDHTRLPSH